MSHCPKTLNDAVWYANGTLAPDVRRAFEAHLATCGECRAAVEFDARLARTMEATAANVLPAPQAAWRRLEERLEADDAATRAADAAETSGGRKPALERRARIMQLAVVAQAAAILLLVGVLWVVLRPPGVQTFHTLGTQDEALLSGEPLVRVVFSPGYSYAAAVDVAAAAGAELLGRLEGSDIYTLAVRVRTGEQRADRLADVLAALRQHPDVLMAQPINDPQGPDW